LAARLASFTDPAADAGSADDYTAVIDWGDSTPSSRGRITAAENGTFNVSGSHAYAKADFYLIGVTLARNDSQAKGGNKVAAYSSVRVAEAQVGRWGGSQPAEHEPGLSSCGCGVQG
jgi:hypothetical protein